MAKQETKLDHVKYVGNHPHVSAVDFDLDFERDKPVGPLSEEVINALTRNGEHEHFKRCAAPPAPKPALEKKEEQKSSTPSGTE
jgi:hypothetical protein